MLFSPRSVLVLQTMITDMPVMPTPFYMHNIIYYEGLWSNGKGVAFTFASSWFQSLESGDALCS